MPSPPPLEYGCYYHIYNRGNNRENIFKEEPNYRHFLKLYAYHIEPVADTFVYCLLPNHFHFLVRIKTEEEIKAQPPEDFEIFRVSPDTPLRPSQQFSNFFNAYTKSINKGYYRTGSLFEHPFGRILVNSEAYFWQLVIYIHQNPQRHGLVADFRDWPYSSYHALLSTKATKLKREVVFGWLSGVQNLIAQHSTRLNEAPIAPLIGDDFD